MNIDIWISEDCTGKCAFEGEFFHSATFLCIERTDKNKNQDSKVVDCFSICLDKVGEFIWDVRQFDYYQSKGYSYYFFKRTDTNQVHRDCDICEKEIPDGDACLHIQRVDGNINIHKECTEEFIKLINDKMNGQEENLI